MTARILAIVTTALALSSCFQKAELVGIVIDQSSEPISGAEVTIENSAFRTITDSSGVYSLPYAAGSFMLRIEQKGYTGYRSNLTISEKTKFPVEKVILFRMPEEPGIAVFEKGRFSKIEEGTLISVDMVNSSDPLEQLLSSSSKSRFYRVEGVPAILQAAPGTGFVDTDGTSKRIFKVGEDAVIARRDFGASLSGDHGNVLDIKPEAVSGDLKIWRLPEQLPDGLYAFARVGAAAGTGLGFYGRDIMGDQLVNAPVYLFEVTNTGNPKLSSKNGYYPVTEAFDQSIEKSLRSAENQEWKEAYITLRAAINTLPSKKSGEIEKRIAEYFENGLRKAVKEGDWAEAKLIAQLQPPTKELELLVKKVTIAAEVEEETEKGHQNLESLARGWRDRGDLLSEMEAHKEAANSYETALALLRKLYTEKNPNYQETADRAFERESRVIRHSLAWLLATCDDPSVRDGERAIELARAVVSTWGNNNDNLVEWVCWRTLAAAYAEASDFKTAIKAQNKSILLMSSASLKESEKQGFLQSIVSQVAFLKIFKDSKSFINKSPDLDYAWDKIQERLNGEVSHQDLVGVWRHPITIGPSGNRDGVFELKSDGKFKASRSRGGSLHNLMVGTWKLQSKTLILRVEEDFADRDFKHPYELTYSVDALSDGHLVWVTDKNRLLVCSKVADYFPSLSISQLSGRWTRVHQMESYGPKFVDFVDRARRIAGSGLGWLFISAEGTLMIKEGSRDGKEIPFELFGDCLITKDGSYGLRRIHNLEDSILEMDSSSGYMNTFIRQ